MDTSFDDCSRELLSKVNAHGRAVYEQWRKRDGYQDVVRFVEGFTNRFIYTLSSADIQDAVERTGGCPLAAVIYDKGRYHIYNRRRHEH